MSGQDDLKSNSDTLPTTRDNKRADKLFIHQLAVPAMIGVFPNERQAPQTLLMDLEISVNIAAAAAQDDLTRTVDYAAICHAIVQYVEQTAFQLIETLADRLAFFLKQQFQLHSLRLRVTKKPFDLPEVAHVSIEVER
jgi:7,8-dihydroneopterin aldolase/epimerase/oxygenase